jgi:DNA polymerase-3 subunit epsilon
MAIQMHDEMYETEKALLNAYGFFWKKKGENKFILEDRYGDLIDKMQAINDIKDKRVAKLPTQCYLDRPAAILWAKTMDIARPMYLDTECTGLKEKDVVIQIGIKDHVGDTILNTLVHNDGVPIAKEAQDTHHISEDMLEDAPSFTEVWHIVQQVLRCHKVVIYNSRYDIKMLRQTYAHHGLDFPSEDMLDVHCLMRRYAEYHGETYPGGSSYVSQKLEKACEEFGIEPGGHDALADAEATRQLLIAIARS